MTVLQRNNAHVLEGTGPTLVYGSGFGCSQKMWDRITHAFLVQAR